MKIGFDAKRAFINQTGLGNYSRRIILSLLEHFPQHEYFLFTSETMDTEFNRYIKSLANVTIVEPKSKLFKARWRSYGITALINKFGLDVYHGLSNELPYNIRKARAKKLITIHDLIPFKEDVFRNPVEDYFYKSKMHSGCRNADSIVAISQATKDDIKFFFGTADEKIHVNYQPVYFNEYPDVDIISKYNLPPKFILQVGTVEYRKNIQIIIKAMIKLKDPELHLVIVGRKKRFWKSLFSYGTNNGVGNNLHFIDPIPDSELPSFYKRSSAIMYPSLYEGFGLPIVEAIHYDKPVLSTKDSCFKEAGGPGAWYCDTTNLDAVAETIVQMLKTDNSAMITEGKRHIAQFSSYNSAKALMALYSK